MKLITFFLHFGADIESVLAVVFLWFGESIFRKHLNNKKAE
jgi:hypothetical protein